MERDQSAKARKRLQEEEERLRQFNERLRIAEHILQALGEAGYSCELADNSRRTLKRLH